MLAEQESRSGEEERLRLGHGRWPLPKDGAKLVAVPTAAWRSTVLTLQGIWLDVGELAQVTGSDERGFLGSLGESSAAEAPCPTRILQGPSTRWRLVKDVP